MNLIENNVPYNRWTLVKAQIYILCHWSNETISISILLIVFGSYDMPTNKGYLLIIIIIKLGRGL